MYCSRLVCNGATVGNGDLPVQLGRFFHQVCFGKGNDALRNMRVWNRKFGIRAHIWLECNGALLSFLCQFTARPIRRNPKVRVKKALELYTAHIGVPDRIFFQTILWDVQMWHEQYGVPALNSELWNRSVSTFHRNVADRIHDIFSMVAPTVQVGLHTSVYGARGGELMRKFSLIFLSKDVYFATEYTQ